MMPLNQRVSTQGTLNQHLKVLHLFSVQWYFIWGSIHLTCCISPHNSRCKQSVSQIPALLYYFTKFLKGLLLTSHSINTGNLLFLQFNKQTSKNAARKNQVFLLQTTYISKTKQTSANNAGHCLTHLNNTICKIWSILHKVPF